MHNYITIPLSLFFILFLSIGSVHAECIVTTENFSKSSRIIYINPTNGSDQLAKIYNYNLENVKNPYQPRQIVAFQSIEEALANRNTAAGDLVLIKAGSNWTNYDVWSNNKQTEFNELSVQASSYSQSQCKGEKLTWVVPAAVTSTQRAAAPPVRVFNDASDITVTNSDPLVPASPIANQTPETNPLQNTTSTSSSRKSSGGSSSGGSSTGANSPATDLNDASDSQQKTTNPTIASQSQPQNQSTIVDTAPDEDALAGVAPDLIDEHVIDNDVPIIDSIQNKVESAYTAECTANAPWENAIQTYPQDSDGWSIIKPDIETKIVYVSSSEGDDSLGQTYNGLGMDDPFNPDNVQAYKTIEKAYAQIRDHKPDWILLKKGDQFELEKTLWLKTGKSQNAHMVFGSYGDKNVIRPVLDSKEGNVIQGLRNRSFITIMGIEFYASRSDPSSPDFLGWGHKGKNAFTNLASNVNGDRFLRGIHIENNRFNYFAIGIVMGSMEEAINTNIVIRRNEILNSYSEDNHSQGMLLSQLNGALIEENILDHNGWYQQRPLSVPINTKTKGYATFFNHNIYINNSSNLVIRKNLSSRSSSIGMKFTSNANADTKINTINSQNILLDKNLIIEGEVGFSLGGNRDFNNGYRWDNIQVVENVLSNMGRTQPTNRNIAWNIDVNDWKSGLVCGNQIKDQSNSNLSNLAGIMVQGQNGEVSIDRNTIINQAKMVETYINEKSSSLTSSDNAYILDKNIHNYLDAFVMKEGYLNYDNYIRDILNKLQNNPSSYYDIDKVLDYFRNASLMERAKVISQ